MKTSLVNELARQPLPWLNDDPGGSTIVISSRVRLARNVHDIPFPGRASAEQRAHVFGLAAAAASRIPAFASPLELQVANCDAIDREVLVERHLATRELCQCGIGSGVLVGRDEGLSVMVNEEDHLRIQAVVPGFQLQAAFRRVMGLEKGLSADLGFAFSDRLGYLTACPSNVGTGMRASAMLHVPGLALLEQADGALNAAKELGLAVRGVQGEGTNAVGHFAQLSNQSTLGESEEEILDFLDSLLRRVILLERSARIRVLRDERHRVYDHVGRAYGLLREARMLTSEEAVSYLSALRLGAVLEMFSHLTVGHVHELVLSIQPGHLQARLGRELGPGDRDRTRADIVRETLRKICN